MRRLLFELRYLLKRAPWDTGVPPPELLAFLERNPTGRALDLGCGTGTNAIAMAKWGWQVTGVDFSALAIWRARRNARVAGVNIDLHQGDLTELHDIQGPFDLGLDIGCFHSLPTRKQARYVSRLAQWIRPGGTVLLYTFLEPNNEGTHWPTESSLQQHFSNVFNIVAIEHGLDRQRSSAWLTLQRRD